MQDFIQSVTKSLGIGENTAQSATGAVLQLIQKQAGPGDFDQLVDKLPGASALLKKAPVAEAAKTGSGGGLLGGMMSKAASAIGGDKGAALGALGMLKQTGLDASKIGPFVSSFFAFAKNKAGADLIGRILGQVPELKSLVG